MLHKFILQLLAQSFSNFTSFYVYLPEAFIHQVFDLTKSVFLRGIPDILLFSLQCFLRILSWHFVVTLPQVFTQIFQLRFPSERIL